MVSDIMMLFCGVLKIYFFLVFMGLMMCVVVVSEIIGVCVLVVILIIEIEFGFIDELMIIFILFLEMKWCVFLIVCVVLEVLLRMM